VSPKRRRVGGTFVLAAVLAILSLFVLHGAVSGVVALAAMLVFIAACIQALRGEGGDTADRTGLAGWFGGWF
jgi:cobalamin synthase